MKSVLLKLLKVVLLSGLMVMIAPQLPSLLDPLLTPPAVSQPKAVVPPPGVRHLERVEDLVFAMTNQARLAKGLPALIKDEELRRVAQAYSDDMLVRRFFDHSTPEGVSFDERISDQYQHQVNFIGENIWFAAGYNPERSRKLAQEIVSGWLISPGHRENILSPDFTHLGVGISVCRRTILATQEFVRRSRSFVFFTHG